MNNEDIYHYNHSDQVKYEIQYGCTFCAQFDERISLGVSEAIFGAEFNRILYEDEHFVIVAALGHLVEGYVLIVSRRHFESFARLPAALQQSFLTLKNKLSDILREEYRIQPIFFEHGPNCNHQRGGACIDHAHIHVVPLNINFKNHIPPSLLLNKIESISDLWSMPIHADYSYLFFECGESEIYLVETNEYVPSQYFRRIIAAHAGIPDKWDWKQYIGKKYLNKTISKLNGKIH